MLNIDSKWFPFLGITDIETHPEDWDDGDFKMIKYYKTILDVSDSRILQYQREKSLQIPTTLTSEEYQELEQLRQACTEEIRKITPTPNSAWWVK